MRTIYAEVSAVERVTRNVARITFHSAELDGFVTDFADQFATLLFPVNGQERPRIVPGFTWEGWQAMPDEIRPEARNYTIRRYHPERSEVEIDFILHGDVGFGTRWATNAKPGDQVAMWGPRVGYNPPPDADWQLLIGDDTGLPAIGAILESLPAGSRARVLVEVTGPEDEQHLESAAEFDITWLHRGETEIGRSLALIDAVKALPPFEGRVYAWGGGEMDLMTAYGKHLRRERGLKTASISAIGYWRIGMPHT
jgi:NADPH-dependent ferric siderophore reductase